MKITITLEYDEKELFKMEETKVEKGDSLEPSQYAKVFDESCIGWSNDHEYNLMFLKQQQACANAKLRVRKHLLLNEVYDQLGIPRTKAGTVVGWVYDEKNPIGDNFVDFNIYNDRNQAFINGYCETAILDFNVDGDISKYLD